MGNTSEKNPLPTSEVIATEKKARHADVAGVVSFNKDKLKKTNTTEKNMLPTNQDIQAEQKKKEVAEVSSFNKKLNETKTNEKNTLPTEEVIASEKKARHADVAGVVSFNKDKL